MKTNEELIVIIDEVIKTLKKHECTIEDAARVGSALATEIARYTPVEPSIIRASKLALQQGDGM